MHALKLEGSAGVERGVFHPTFASFSFASPYFILTEKANRGKTRRVALVLSSERRYDNWFFFLQKKKAVNLSFIQSFRHRTKI